MKENYVQSLLAFRGRCASVWFLILVMFTGSAGVFSTVYGGYTIDDTSALCATVKIQIKQELTLERQAFDLNLYVNNPLKNIVMEQFNVDIWVKNGDGNGVQITEDPDQTNALFFVREESLKGIDDVSGGGRIEGETEADIHWLMIPAYGAGGTTSEGLGYSVGATISYRIDGIDYEMDVEPDVIQVKAMPKLVLDYFLPSDVYGDDAFTMEIEPSVPFPLGLRIKNDGPGAAQSLKIDSGQPEIIENNTGLLIGFRITGCEVNGMPFKNSLLADFGNIEAETAGIAQWRMECTLSGRFTEFEASFTHADELGGMLTSLIQDPINTHFLVHEVLNDLPGQDTIRDFLAKDDAVYTLFGSDCQDYTVDEVPGIAALSSMRSSDDTITWTLTVPERDNPFYACFPFGETEWMDVISAYRDDAKVMSDANVWFSKTRAKGETRWRHYLNLFDMNGGGTYTVNIRDTSGEPRPPQIGYIGDKVTYVGDVYGLGFLVEASDPNGTVPVLTSSALPDGATLETVTNGSVVTGTFFWRPQEGQEGIYPLRFEASDGELSDYEALRIYVGHEGEATNAAGIPVSLTNVGAVAYVAAHGAHIWPYASWDNAATSLQAAVGVCWNDSVVYVSNGLYTLTNTVVVTNSLQICGVGNTPPVIDGASNIQCFMISHPDAALHSLVIRNGYAEKGGGVYLREGLVANCVVEQNAAATDGGGLYCDGGVVQFCTVVSNSAVYSAGGIYCKDPAIVMNSILYANAASNACDGYADSSNCFAYCCATNALEGVGNIQADPLFSYAENMPYRLNPVSPCVNAGTNSVSSVFAHDIEGVERPVFGSVDIGASEYAGPPAAPVLFAPTNLSAHSFDVEWHASGVVPATNWMVCVSNMTDGSEDVTSFVDAACSITGLLPGVAYSCSVAGQNEYGSGVFSSNKYVETLSEAAIAVAHEQLNYQAVYQGQIPDAQIFVISNAGQTTCSFKCVPAEEWISMRPRAGLVAPGESMIITTLVNHAELTVGRHCVTNMILSVNATNSPYPAPVVDVTVSKAGAAVSLDNLAQMYTASGHVVAVTTVPEGLCTEVLYDGLTNQPVDAGVYTVSVAVCDSEPLYYGSCTGLLTITRAEDRIDFSQLDQIYDGYAHCISARSMSGNDVVVTYDGDEACPVNAGSYMITGLVDTPNWHAVETAVLTIGRASQIVSNFNLPGSVVWTQTVTLAAQGGGSSNPVQFDVLSGPAWMPNETTLQFSAVGDVKIIASQEGSQNYLPAQAVTSKVTVLPLVPTIVMSRFSNIGVTSALLNATIIDSKFATVTERGFFIGSTPGFSQTNALKLAEFGFWGTGSYSMAAPLTGLHKIVA